MKYKVNCYNGGPIFHLDWIFINFDEVTITVEAEDENDALIQARNKVFRDYYKVISVE
jgi:hypothetical protein